MFYFFFSSRRRHTRYIGDWSSDVCSSDLEFGPGGRGRRSRSGHDRGIVMPSILIRTWLRHGQDRQEAPRRRQIGRASCRERVEISVVAGSVKKKKKDRKKIRRMESNCLK